MNMTTDWTKILSGMVLAFGIGMQSAQAAAPATPQGIITGKQFSNITGTTIANLTNSTKFPNNPDALFFFPYFEWNATGDIALPPGNLADNYGGQIIGYFYPPATGDYVFYLAADDNAVLYLSTDATATNKKLIARETTWSNPREYLLSGGNSDLTAKDSSQFTGTEWAKDPATGLAKITLQANQPYYIEALFKEGGGGDNLSVAVLDPNFTIDSNSPIPGQYLSSDRTAGPVTITTQPASQTIPERGSVTFSVMPDGTPPYTYQWRRNGVDIQDATGLTYSLSPVTMADNNARFTVVVTGAEGSATSQEATLTVAPDTTVPTILGAKGSPSLNEVVLSFSEPLDPTSAAAIANYQISSAGGALAVNSATLSPSGTSVTLATAAQTLGTKYTINVSGVKDTAATPNTVAAGSKVVFFPAGKLVEQNGMIVFEAENYDRNLDGRWERNTTRGTPSGGASMLIPNGAGGNESGTKLEYDVEFAQAGTYYVWIRASADNGNDDSMWFHIDGDGDGTTERPIERDLGNNSASMTGFQPQADFVWRSDSQDGPDPFTVEVPAPGLRAVAVARREDGAFFDKMILTTDSTFTPTGVGPAETRQGAPGLPTVTLTGLTAGQTFTAGGNINLTANAAGQSGLNITRVQYTANGVVIGESTTSPFSFTWSAVPAGVYGIRATAYDELGQATTTESIAVIVESPTAQGANIAWVSFHPADGTPSGAARTAGFTNAPDVAYTDLLKSAGHTVTRIITSGNPDRAVLNAYDLVIISRSVPSGDYELDAETAAWNGITAPTMILGGYVIRDSRLGLMSGRTIPDTTEPIKLTVLAPTHPIFEGIQLDASNVMVNDYAGLATFNGTVQRGISVVTEPPVTGGEVLATGLVGGLDGTIIAEFPAGTVTSTTPPDTLGGDRLVFLTGSREAAGLTAEGAGIFDLTADGAKMFLNAVEYMSGVEGGGPAPTLSFTRTATGMQITFTGTLQSSTSITGGWADVTTTSPYNVTANESMRFFRAKQ